MKPEETTVQNYQNRLKELIKNDYPYLIMGLLVVASAGTFLYFQLSPIRGLNRLNLQSDSDIVNKEVLEKTTQIAGIIEENQIDYISLTPPQPQQNVSPTNGLSLSKPEENGQISAISSDQVTNTAKTYTVAEGDSLAYIAGVFYGDRNAWVRIAEANGLMDNPDGIYAGMVLQIPR